MTRTHANILLRCDKCQNVTLELKEMPVSRSYGMGLLGPLCNGIPIRVWDGIGWLTIGALDLCPKCAQTFKELVIEQFCNIGVFCQYPGCWQENDRGGLFLHMFCSEHHDLFYHSSLFDAIRLPDNGRSLKMDKDFYEYNQRYETVARAWLQSLKRGETK